MQSTANKQSSNNRKENSECLRAAGWDIEDQVLVASGQYSHTCA